MEFIFSLHHLIQRKISNYDKGIFFGTAVVVMPRWGTIRLKDADARMAIKKAASEMSRLFLLCSEDRLNT